MEPRSVEDVLKLEAAGDPMKFLFFWGHQPARSGQIGQGCLSQWWEGTFTENGIAYPSAEHYMMAGKARLFGDERTEARILAAGHPKEAKDLGRQVKAFDEAVWVAHRFDLVVRGNLAKFGQDPALRAYLLGTGRRILVEASPLDRVWGIGLRAEDARAGRPSQWLGLNLLGFALMEVRARLPESGI